jgi:hypothetical protein
VAQGKKRVFVVDVFEHVQKRARDTLAYGSTDLGDMGARVAVQAYCLGRRKNRASVCQRVYKLYDVQPDLFGNSHDPLYFAALCVDDEIGAKGGVKYRVSDTDRSGDHCLEGEPSACFFSHD